MKTSSILISCKDYDDIGKIISHFFGNTVISFKLIEQLFSDKE